MTLSYRNSCVCRLNALPPQAADPANLTAAVSALDDRMLGLLVLAGQLNTDSRSQTSAAPNSAQNMWLVLLSRLKSRKTFYELQFSTIRSAGAAGVFCLDGIRTSASRSEPNARTLDERSVAMASILNTILSELDIKELQPVLLDDILTRRSSVSLQGQSYAKIEANTREEGNILQQCLLIPSAFPGTAYSPILVCDGNRVHETTRGRLSYLGVHQEEILLLDCPPGPACTSVMERVRAPLRDFIDSFLLMPPPPCTFSLHCHDAFLHRLAWSGSVSAVRTCVGALRALGSCCGNVQLSCGADVITLAARAGNSEVKGGKGRCTRRCYSKI